MDWKKIGKKLLFPPGWVMVVLTIISAAALIAYLIDALSAYTLCVVTILLVRVLPMHSDPKMGGIFSRFDRNNFLN